MFVKLSKLALAICLMFSTSALAAEKMDLLSEVTLFKNVNVWDGTSDTLKNDHDVLIVENKIKKVAKEIPTMGTYEMDVRTGGVKQAQ